MLTQRQEKILQLIIQTFTATEAPVGSKFLMESGVKASSATIRNDMSVLEELGLLVKTHSSSGRVPSLAGLRYYVDQLVAPTQLSLSQTQKIQQAFLRPFKEIDEIVEASAKILSQLTSYTTFFFGPEIKERKLTGFRIVPLNDRQIIAIIVTDHGNVENQIFNIPESVSASDLEKVVNIINERLVGLPLLSVYHKLRTEIPMILQRYFQAPTGVGELFDELLSEAFVERVFVGGKMNLLDFHLHKDLQQFRSVYSLMENREEMTSLIESQVSLEKPIAVTIGDEIGNQALNDMALVTTCYEVSGHGHGTLALLGPTNMSYGDVLGLMSVFKLTMEDRLSDYYRGLEHK